MADLTTFGALLQRLRVRRDLSLRDLARLVYCSHSHLHLLEAGRAKPNRQLRERLDQVLDANGALVDAPVLPATPGEDEYMRRRTIIASLTALTGAAVAPAVALEATRHGLAAALGDLPDIDGWNAIVADYACGYHTTAPADVVRDLSADLVVLQHLMAADPESRDLRRIAAQLGIVMALALGSNGRSRDARRWWATARGAADRSGCAELAAQVRGEELVRGLYEQRPLPELFGLAAQATTNTPGTGRARVLAGVAQAYALSGQGGEARAALTELAQFYERLPSSTAVEDDILGWPEYCLHHTVSYVHTHLGDTAEAYRAQEQAFALYPQEMARSVVMIRLHRARCLIADGDIRTGLTEGTAALDAVPAFHHGGPVGVLARGVLTALPATERSRTDADELRQRLSTSTLV